MINLNIDVNVVDLTLSENVPISYQSNTTYLFEFYSNQTHQSIYFLSTDLNAGNDNDYRFNRFNITLVSNPQQIDPSSGVIYLPNTGFYEYKVYSQEVSDLRPQPTDVVVEYGRVYYEYSDVTITSFSPDIEIIAYNG